MAGTARVPKLVDGVLPPEYLPESVAEAAEAAQVVLPARNEAVAARDAAVTAREAAVDAADRAEAVGDTNDTIMAAVASDAGSAFATQLEATIVDTGGDVFALKDELPEGAVTSQDVTNIIVTDDPDVVASAPPGTLVYFAEPSGVHSDFLVGVSEVSPVWAGNPANVSHVDGTILRYEGESADGVYGFVLDGDPHRNVNIVARVRYSRGSDIPGLKCLVFARGTGGVGSEYAVYAGIQAQASDSAPNGGLRLNAFVNGAIALAGPTAQINRSAAWRNTEGDWYYIRLVVAADSLVAAKQWPADDPEPANWDLAIAPENIPGDFKAGGAAAQGWCGFAARHRFGSQDFDYMAVAFDGASAPLREDL